MPTYKKKVSDGLGFASKAPYEYDGKKFEADLQHGDKITLLNSGVEEDGNYGMQTNFKIQTRNGEKKTSFNQRTINALIDEYGDEGDNWVNKELTVLLQKTIIGGKKCIVAYFVCDGWELDEYGELVKTGSQIVGKQPIPDEDDLNGIPF